MIVTLACVVFSCGKDEEPLPPLSLAYIELESAADATQLLPGDAGSKTFSVAASRKFVANANVDWCSAAVNVEAQTITLTVTRNAYVASTKPSKRNGIITITALPEREGDDVSNIKLDVNVEQALYGLPEADMFNVVFNATGALDTSPLTNIINTPQVAPTTKMNTVYNRFSAIFSGNRANGHAGTMFYQIPLYTTTLTWDQLTAFGVDRNALPNPTLTALGQAFDYKNFTVEGIISNTFKDAAGNDLYGEQEFISIQQSGGWGLGFEGGNAENGGTFVFYYAWSDKLLEYDNATASNSSYKFGIEPAVEGQPVIGAQPNVFYHVVVTTDFAAHKITAYVDGKLIGERGFNETTTTVTLPCGANKFANWLGLGADPNNPPTREEGVTDLPKVTSQYSANGELVVARIYNKTLTATEVELLYQYEKP